MRNLVVRSLQGADVDVQEALLINKRYYYSHMTVHTTAYAGVCEGLRVLNEAGHQLALFSNKPGEACRAIMEHFGLDGYFTKMIGGGDVENLKPEPDGIYECLQYSGMRKSQAWMIGDHHTDLLVAKNAGINSAHVSYGFGDRLDHEADVSFASFSDLVRHFV